MLAMHPEVISAAHRKMVEAEAQGLVNTARKWEELIDAMIDGHSVSEAVDIAVQICS